MEGTLEELRRISNCPEGATFSRRSLRKSVRRYRGANANSVRVWLRSGGFFEAHRANELVEIVDDALVETVELGLLVGV